MLRTYRFTAGAESYNGRRIIVVCRRMSKVSDIWPIAFLHRLLAHPLTAGLSLDDPSTTELRKQTIFSKPFLKAIYDEWYRMLAAEVPAGPGAVLELGSGAGYCDRYISGLITSEVFCCPSVQLVVDARQIP